MTVDVKDLCSRLAAVAGNADEAELFLDKIALALAPQADATIKHELEEAATARFTEFQLKELDETDDMQRIRTMLSNAPSSEFIRAAIAKLRLLQRRHDAM